MKFHIQVFPLVENITFELQFSWNIHLNIPFALKQNDIFVGWF